MKSILKAPEKIGNEMEDTLNKGIEEIHDLMNDQIVTVYKIAKRITYDFDLFKKDKRLKEFTNECNKKIGELQQNELKNVA